MLTRKDRKRLLRARHALQKPPGKRPTGNALRKAMRTVLTLKRKDHGQA